MKKLLLFFFSLNLIFCCNDNEIITKTLTNEKNTDSIVLLYTRKNNTISEKLIFYEEIRNKKIKHEQNYTFEVRNDSVFKEYRFDKYKFKKLFLLLNSRDTVFTGDELICENMKNELICNFIGPYKVVQIDEKNDIKKYEFFEDVIDGRTFYIEFDNELLIHKYIYINNLNDTIVFQQKKLYNY